MDAYLKKEQNCTLFVWGHRKGGLGGGVSGGSSPKFGPPSTSFFYTLLFLA